MIHLFDNWYLDADANNYVIGERFLAKEKNRKGEEIEVYRLSDMKFFAKLEHALNGAVKYAGRKAIEKEKVKDVISLQKFYTKRLNEVARLFSELDGVVLTTQNATEKPLKPRGATKKQK